MDAFNPLVTWHLPEESKPRRVHSAALRRSSDVELARTTTATRAARRRDARGSSGTRPRRAPANSDDVDESADEDIASRGGGVRASRARPGLRVGKSGRCRPERARGLCAGGAVARAPPPRITRDTSDPGGLGTRLLDTSAPQFSSRSHSSARDMAEDAPPPAPWWAAPASGVVTAPRRPPGDAGSASSSGAYGCDVRTEHGRRKRGARPPPRIGATASAPTTAVDAAALRDALAASPLACVNITATWCAPCVRFHPKFLDLSAAFPDVAFVSVDIDTLDDDALDELAVETVPCFLLMRRGREVARLVGVAHKRPAKPLAAAIRRHLAS